jgi:hypothetical protein
MTTLFRLLTAGVAATVMAGTANAQQKPAPPDIRGDSVIQRLLQEYARTEWQFNLGSPSAPSAPSAEQKVDLQSVEVTDMIRNRSNSKPTICAIPLTPMKVNPSQYAMRQITPAPMDKAMVSKPSAPACAEKSSAASAPKPPQ